MKKLFVIFILALQTLGWSQNLTNAEKELYNLVMQYRSEKGLPAIPISRSLTFVAQTHVKDLTNNQPVQGNCNLHSWSSNGNWTACCYTPDHAEAECMWSKPSELTAYQGNGYEISYYSSGMVTPLGALNGWKSSPGHNAVMINSGIWDSEWNAIGIGIYGNYAVIWFGNELDNK
jgi:uncharacterized protein YkwD